jgi:D-tagatose-1,6-bisphosphate aldolase subunit GatZ/KbaZ
MTPQFSPAQSLIDLVAAHRAGQPLGIASICSANHFVIEACMKHASQNESFLLLEATSNQVNQHGGYTGLTPAAFAAFAGEIAASMHFPSERLLLGGDHLGPNPWSGEDSAAAMLKAARMVSDYARAGFVKIHLDASMPCADDPAALDPQVAAGRAADLCQAAEEAAPEAPVYVIGTEVPPPGGALVGETLHITRAEDASRTIKLHRHAFAERGLHGAWQRVIAVVVQPGVEYGNDFVLPYDRRNASHLSRFIENVPGLVYEAHSTDYQLPCALSQMGEDHFAILKVGPALTFALREALFALADIENEITGSSSLLDILESAMLSDKSHWRKYYSGTERQQALARRYSFSDRVRYYWAKPEVDTAVQALLHRLQQNPPPVMLLSQFLPVQYSKVREGSLSNTPLDLIYDRIIETAAAYPIYRFSRE